MDEEQIKKDGERRAQIFSAYSFNHSPTLSESEEAVKELIGAYWFLFDAYAQALRTIGAYAQDIESLNRRLDALAQDVLGGRTETEETNAESS